jgi:hypothetical protein
MVKITGCDFPRTCNKGSQRPGNPFAKELDGRDQQDRRENSSAPSEADCPAVLAADIRCQFTQAREQVTGKLGGTLAERFDIFRSWLTSSS